jgi:hypothetical protein
MQIVIWNMLPSTTLGRLRSFAQGRSPRIQQTVGQTPDSRKLRKNGDYSAMLVARGEFKSSK